MRPAHITAALGAALLAFVAVAAPDAPRPDGESPAGRPMDLGLEEKVDVQLVLVDLLVLGRDGSTVPGLVTGDFLLLVDGREVQPASVDTTCSGRPLPDVRPGDAADAAERAGPGADDAEGAGRRIVLAFDYFHMANASVAIDAALEALDRWAAGGDEHMVVTLSQTLGVETEFTRDIGAVRQALQRMRNEPRLYAGSHSGLTLHRYFQRLESLYDVLERVSGRKTIVLFSGPLMPDGFHHDAAYQGLGARSTAARTAIYPVDTGGMRGLFDPLASPLGGPPRLRRLAGETGGRMTSDTNDIALAYGRAHRDQACNYTLGFYASGQLDRKGRLTIRLREPAGRRVFYPEFYVVRSTEKRRRALARTAELAPGAFTGEGLLADLFLLGPDSPRRWDALIGVGIEPNLIRSRADESTPGQEERTWRVRGLLRSPSGALIRSFTRLLPAAESGELVTLFHPLRLRPGHYTLSVVVGDSVEATPRTAVREIVVPEIPRQRTFVVGPLLGRRPEPSGLEPGGKPTGVDFEPLLRGTALQGDPLESSLRVCHVGRDEPSALPRTVSRAIVEVPRHTSSLHAFDPVEVNLPDSGGLRCATLRDDMTPLGLAPGDYRLQASLVKDNEILTAPFKILAPAE